MPPCDLPDRGRGDVAATTRQSASFWDGLAGSVITRDLGDKLGVNNTICVGLHGDGAFTTSIEGPFAISWSSTTARGSTKTTRQVYAAVPKICVSSGALQSCWTIAEGQRYAKS